MSDVLAGKEWEVVVGDALAVLPTLPDGCVQCCITSPPYWGLRDYGTASWDGGDPECDHEKQPARGGRGGSGPNAKNTEGAYPAEFAASVCGKCGARRIDAQLGLEPTPEEYVAALVALFREVRRVLRDDGVAWVNLGDSYAANRGYQVPDGKHTDVGNSAGMKAGAIGLKPKDLVGIPWRVAFALQADGWYLRSDIVWAKGWSFCPDRAGNPMPESVEDRPVRAHEYVFLLAKSERYFYDHMAVREAAAEETLKRLSEPSLDTQEGGFKQEQYAEDFPGCKRRDRKPADILKHMRDNDGGRTRNLRDVWAVNTCGFPGAHFATFPPALVEPMVLAGSAANACSGCGAAWQRVVEKTGEPCPTAKGSRFDAGKTAVRDGGDRTQAGERFLKRQVGWQPTCTCDAPTVPGLVLDPFCGSGTTGAVALQHGRRFLGIELSPAYADMARERLGYAARGLKPPVAPRHPPSGMASLFEEQEQVA